ncbi:MAG: carboxylating nicotinate-nucleotide diphosphorylase [Epsilonproteobacteria bacterium]|nr:carboxylating nicotinate-nucleotide diphosphorylase [Campylobacterota bacterium]
MITEALKNFLKEDIGPFDLTAPVGRGKRSKAKLICRSGAILCGIDFFEQIFRLLDKNANIKRFFKDGDYIEKSQTAAILDADAAAILSGERTALNLISRLSGIATLTREFVDQIAQYKTVLLDTRKTTPGMRIFEKYATGTGGASNHRLGLYDCAMIKDNHIKVAGSISAAIKEIKPKIPFTAKIEVEVKNIDEFREAVEGEADIILLDHFEIADIERVVKQRKEGVKLEVSGNVDKNSIRALAATGIDYISTGFITHHAVWSDFALKII